MGLIKATLSAAKHVLEEQWREQFACDALGDKTLLVRGRKRIGARSANTRVDDGVLTNGSLLTVADGQAVIVVAQGKVVDVCTEPGAHLFEDPNHPGGLNGYVKDVWERVGFGGGDVQPIQHRVYYVNTKEITDNRFETPAPVPIRTGDAAIGLDLEASVLCRGVYSYRVTDPEKLYRALIGNIGDVYLCNRLNGQLHSRLLTALQTALFELTEEGIRPSQIPGCIPKLRELLRQRFTEQTQTQYGITIVSAAIEALYVVDAAMIQELQAHAVLKDPNMAMAYLAGAAAGAMQAAAANRGVRGPNEQSERRGD